MCPCLHVSMFSCVHVSVCPCLLVSTSPCVHVFLYPSFRVHVSMFSISACLHVYYLMFPCLHVIMSPSLSLHPHCSHGLHVSMSIFPCFWNSAKSKSNSEKNPTSAKLQKSPSVDTLRQTENGTNGKQQLSFVLLQRKRKRKTSVCLLQTETESGSLFSFVGKR
jgi:hypothetical protein